MSPRSTRPTFYYSLRLLQARLLEREADTQHIRESLDRRRDGLALNRDRRYPEPGAIELWEHLVTDAEQMLSGLERELADYRRAIDALEGIGAWQDPK